MAQAVAVAKKKFRVQSGSLIFGNLTIFDQEAAENAWTITDRAHLDRWLVERGLHSSDIDWTPYVLELPASA
jgi:hypothetical protein